MARRSLNLSVCQKEKVQHDYSKEIISADARAAARGSHVHVELIDLNRFIGLWQEFYEKLTDEDKSRLPLRPIYFLATGE